MGQMVRHGDAIICYEPMREVSRESRGEKWCFKCRKRREFFFIIDAPVEPSYYGPNAYIQCAGCGTTDSDLFPGWTREWEDD